MAKVANVSYYRPVLIKVTTFTDGTKQADLVVDARPVPGTPSSQIVNLETDIPVGGITKFDFIMPLPPSYAEEIDQQSDQLSNKG